MGCKSHSLMAEKSHPGLELFIRFHHIKWVGTGDN